MNIFTSHFEKRRKDRECLVAAPLPLCALVAATLLQSSRSASHWAAQEDFLGGGQWLNMNIPQDPTALGVQPAAQSP